MPCTGEIIMAGKMCTGAVTKNAALPHQSIAYCEGMLYRSEDTAANRPITGNPHDGDGSEAEVAWDAGWTAADNASVVFTLTGSIDPTASVNVVGIGTLFETELVSGDSITVSGETRIVDVITDNLNLTVTVAFTDVANDTSPDRVRAAALTRTQVTCCSLSGITVSA